jgi:hypothetical protein
LLGIESALSPSTVSRLNQQFKVEYEAWGALASGCGETVPNGEIRSAFDLAVTAQARKEMAVLLRRRKVRERAVTGMK